MHIEEVFSIYEVYCVNITMVLQFFTEVIGLQMLAYLKAKETTMFVLSCGAIVNVRESFQAFKKELGR